MGGDCTRRAALTGAPGAGKSSLLAELADRGFATCGEVAREILKSSGGMELRRDDPIGFAEAMLDAQLACWDSGWCLDAEPKRPDIVIFDRGFPDIIGFLRVEGLPIPARIDEACRKYRYDGPIFRASAWREIYQCDKQRIQNWQQAVASDAKVSQAWRDYGYDLIELPRASISARADFIAGLM